MDQFAKSLIEKVFLGAIAAVVSAFVLHSYNLHLKAFEGAQTQLRSISTISIKSKDDIILAVGEIRTIANSLPLKLSVKVRPSEEIVRQIVNIRSASAVLESRLPAAAAVASGLIHTDDSQIARSSSSSRHESRNRRQRHPGRPPSTRGDRLGSLRAAEACA